MPKGPSLTSAEREEIETLRASNLSARDIAKRIDRSKTVVLNYLKNPTKYGTAKRSGRKRALTKAQEEEIVRALSTGHVVQVDRGGGGGADGGAEGTVVPIGSLSAERIKQEFGLQLSTRRVQQLLSDWRWNMRKALDQQHALLEVPQEEQEETEVTGSALPPPSEVQDDDEERTNTLLDAIPPQPSLVLEGDAPLEIEPSQPTEEVRV